MFCRLFSQYQATGKARVRQRPLQNLNHIKPAKRNSFIVVISFACGLMILTISSDNLIVLIRCYPRFLCLHRATLGEFILLIFFIRDQKYRYVLGRWFFVKFQRNGKRYSLSRGYFDSNFIVLFFAVYGEMYLTFQRS